MTQINYTETLTVVHCTCGMAFAIPDSLNDQLLDNRGPRGKSVYCPLGHRWHYTGQTDAERERAARQAAERREKAVRELLQHEERSHAATKGQLTKTKKQVHRAEHGVCPHCKRSFQDLRRHMESKHHVAS
jgi:hypothetical protein